MKKYTYKRPNGHTIQSDKPLTEKGLKLVTIIKSGNMVGSEVNQKQNHDE